MFASVDEADIGLIQTAKESDKPVAFTVDAHPDEVFDGEIEQIRYSSTETQNVVTYPVVIAAKNPDLKLLPGMTASISFEVDSTEDVPKIPNAALRFFPEELRHVRKDDQYLIDGSTWRSKPKTDEEKEQNSNLTATENAEAQQKKNQRHVWIVDGERLKAVEIRTGLMENKFTEMAQGDLDVGDKLVTGIKD